MLTADQHAAQHLHAIAATHMDALLVPPIKLSLMVGYQVSMIADKGWWYMSCL
jgi:hypothetical protein